MDEVSGPRCPPILDSEDVDRVVDGLLAGRYHVVLGAGASAGCENPAGELPMAPQLAELLLRDLGVAPDPSVDLPSAYEAAVEELGSAHVVQRLRQLYADATPLPWHSFLPKFGWEAIWTLNIDDVVERAYLDDHDRRQRAVVCPWQQRPRILGGPREDVPIVHLHGYVGSVDRTDDPQLVFSMTDYLSALRQADRPNWHAAFRATYPEAPVIIIGARLTEEPDLAAVLRAGNFARDSGFPSFLIRPNISPFDEARYRRWGLTPVSTMASDFFRVLLQAVEHHEARVPSTKYESRYTRRMLRELTVDRADHSPPPRHDFYGGDHPGWSDVLDGLDALPSWVEALVAEISNPRDEPERQLLFAILGSPFSGKSTSLLRIGRDLARKGWLPVLIVGNEKLQTDEMIRFLADRPDAVLLLDPIWLDVGDVAALLRTARRRRQRLLVFACDRVRHREHIRKSVPPTYIVGIETTLFMEPTQATWEQIVEVRGERARLGRLEGATPRECRWQFVTNQGDLYSSLASLEDADGFVTRGLEVFDGLAQPLRHAFASIALLGAFDLPTPVSIASAGSRVDARRLHEACRPGGPLSEWILIDRETPGALRPRHRYLGDLVLRSAVPGIGSRELSNIALAMCLALADRMGVDSIRNKTLEHRIVRSLMDLDTVRLMVPAPEVDDWYAKLESAFDWNARYWEQRALSLTDSPERAFSYARRAVNRHRDSFSLNTLGTVVMRRAVAEDLGSLSTNQRRSYWTEALEALSESRERGHGRFEHPFVTFFSYTRRLIELIPLPPQDWSIQIQQALLDWRAAAENHGMLEDRELKEAVEGFPVEWLPPATTPPRSRASKKSPQRQDGR